MAKITAESREEFNKKQQTYKDLITKSFEKEKSILNLIEKDSSGIAYKKLLLAEEMMYVTTLYLAINSLSVHLLGVNNTDALNEARKTVYKAIIYLEEIVTNVIDAPYSDYEDKVSQISNTPLEKRYYLTRKLGLAIRMVIDAYGDNTKWKWSFVELEGRYATVAKNMLDMKAAVKTYFEPRDPDFDNTVYYIRLIKKLFEKSADAYRDKYELSTKRVDDIRLAINYLIGLRRLDLLLGDKDEAEELKKKAVVWKTKMEADQKKGIAH
ncbi:MAG: hypothetical protein MJ178_05385 [Treponemataceae bacterium]|nr:hypothetical protein [Treponemataceae bacterium]